MRGDSPFEKKEREDPKALLQVRLERWKFRINLGFLSETFPFLVKRRKKERKAVISKSLTSSEKR